MAVVLTMHFHCPACHPQLVRGVTPAICSQPIPAPVVGRGPARKCPACKSGLRAHRREHQR